VSRATSRSTTTGRAVVTADDGEVHRFDVLYGSLGVDPGTRLAVALGAQLDETGNIVTDTHGRSSADNLYAAGDVVRALDQISVAVGYLAISASGLAKMQLFHRIHREQAAGCCG
jgi:pyruvate/2-oxoglutarate dehydrogenase complex dihydrolipoamide dehydrogenase (E3) component